MIKARQCRQSSTCVFFLLFVLVAISALSVSAQPVRLRGNVNPQCTEVRSGVGPGIRFSDIYGDGNIAVQGSYNCNGVFIYDVSNPDAPYLRSWYNPGNSQQFLEAIVIGNRGYFGSGIGNGGVHIVDLTDPSNPVLLGVVDPTHGSGHPIIHEMLVFDQGGHRYLLENYNSLSTTPLKIIDVTDPAAPSLKWTITPTGSGWVHNMVIKGNRIITSQYSGNRLEFYDISNLASQAPTYITSIVGNSNNHSAWPSEDGNYLYSCRELLDGDLRVYDIHDPSQPVLVRSIRASDLNINAICPHNPVVMGNKLYVAWYQAGLQVFDISTPSNPVRVGEYDTFSQAFAPTEKQLTELRNSEPWDMICGGPFQGASLLPSNYDGAWAVYPFLGEDKILAGDVRTGIYVIDVTRATAPARNEVSDFDADGRTDLSAYSPATGVWQISPSSSGGTSQWYRWGDPGDIIVPGDYDGDGSSDEAVYRPSNGTWYVLGSRGQVMITRFGLSTDIPVPGDYDADGKMDIAVWRPSTGVWYILQSTLGFRAVQWGTNGDKPIVGDYEGDGKADVAVWRPSNGVWYILQSSSSIPIYRQFGMSGDRPLYADFDGNGTSDLAVYRPSTGNWYYMDPATQVLGALNFGVAEDVPVPADYDGDGKADIAVFRPSTNYWYRLDSRTGTFFAQQFGQAGDVPSPGSVQPQ